MTSPRSAVLAREFLDRRVDWIRHDSPFYGKTFREMMMPKIDPVTRDMVGRAMLELQTSQEAADYYQPVANELISGFRHRAPNLRNLIIDPEVMQLAITDSDRMLPVLKEVAETCPKPDLAGNAQRLLALVEDCKNKLVIPVTHIERAAKNVDILANAVTAGLADAAKMRRGVTALRTLQAYCETRIENHIDGVNPSGPDVLAQRRDMVAVLTPMAQALEEVAAQVEKERRASPATPGGGV